ncbi:PEBP-like protein [Calocera cornea HHB12733]|uniref:PEBP-like protein n=1 Tax=Calocera cornea HHB12733 TaxID=1353952 RepID=A0A165JFN3_9BASI|nr:PEBP-like protein [Calocera cornea HHB12733]
MPIPVPAVHRAVRSLCARTLLSRPYATNHSTPSPPSAPTPTPTPTPPEEYTPPLPPGQLDIYDLSLALLARDKQAKLALLAHLRAALPALPDGGEEHTKTTARIRKLEIDAEINDPAVRWTFRQGKGDLALPIYRHLTEHKWRHEGALDLLMETLWQMNVIPDLLPWVDPTVDMRLRFPAPPGQASQATQPAESSETRESSPPEPVKPGTFLLPSQTTEPPLVEVTAFHEEERWYTLVMVDPDVPNPATQSYTTFLHWLVPNISFTCLTRSPLPLPPALLPWIPPHPQSGGPYHRYSTFLLPQRGPLPAGAMKAPLRRGFSLREFVLAHDLTGAPAVPGAPKRELIGAHKGNRKGPKVQVNTGAEVGGGGAHMFREKWDESVGPIHHAVFGTSELKYGKPKRPDLYLDEAGSKPKRYY